MMRMMMLMMEIMAAAGLMVFMFSKKYTQVCEGSYI